MMNHPSGGLPTWLLEVGGDTVISLASMSHYYYFGKAFVPTPVKRTVERRKKLTIATQDVIDMILKLLSAETAGLAEPATDASNSSINSSELKSPNGSRSAPVWRRGSNGNDSAGDKVNKLAPLPPRPPTSAMQYLHDVRDGVEPLDELPTLEQVKSAINAYRDVETWRMDQFRDFADVCLSDQALDMIFHRLYGTGVLPSPAMEKELVMREWQEWQTTDVRLWSNATDDSQDPVAFFSRSVQRILTGKADEEDSGIFPSYPGWGGIGGFDGRGGLGYGLMHCIERRWWDAWTAYVGWSWDGQGIPETFIRPPDISTESLLDRASNVVAGTLGSYEVMKNGLQKGFDYVLIPPSVWEVLYELYGGGPPLPRMILPPPSRNDLISMRDRSMSTDSKQMEDGDQVEVEYTGSFGGSSKLLKVPETLMVATHPWIVHCNLCDSSQPYRRGEAGSMSIRIMAAPDQPLWRMFAEIIVRLQVQNSRAIGKDGRGKARLWKRIDATARDAVSRYGPWTLLCKGRSAVWPILHQEVELEDNYVELKEDWASYTDHATVEGVGLTNGDRLMLEYAVMNKNGDFIWPREAAAKAGRARRLADEEIKLRRTLRGVDDNDQPLKNPPQLVGMTVDAMDTKRGWFQVEILKVRVVPVQDPEETEEEEDEDDEEEFQQGEGESKQSSKPSTSDQQIKQVLVDFTGAGGHGEWIDVESERLTVAGKMAMGKPEQTAAQKPTKASDAKNKKEVTKKNGSDASENGGKICSLPGYGACGLANLGNTCYANSAIQCISYMPMLRTYLLSTQYKANGDLNKDNPLGTGGKLLEEFADLLKVMWSGRFGERQPTKFRQQLGKHRTQFSGADQHDAQELLNYMLDVLHEDSNRVKKKPYVEALEDDWVKAQSLPRVGEEAWRRFLRRNRSLMADVAMGQVLNTVTCPKCGFSSRNFDPFNLLSLPFPTVADVIFQCTLLRRATARNCPKILNRAKRGDEKGRKRFKFDEISGDEQPPSEHFVQEQYVIAMSRLADIGDLRLRLQNISGIPAGRLRLCKVETIVVEKELEDHNPVKTYTRVATLPDKEGPCFQFARSTSSNDEVGTSPAAPTRIFAFESTLAPRPMPPTDGDPKEDTADDDTVADDDEEEDEDEPKPNVNTRSAREAKLVKQLLTYYGDAQECRLYDTDALTLSKAVSRSLWPRNESEFKLGLRVDAIDQKGNWFPGSVLEIIEGVAQGSGDDRTNATKRKVRIHFDNFATKWDETYTIDHFHKDNVRPLYSHATPRAKPTEFMVHNRYLEKNNKVITLFGQSFVVQCQSEWSTARAGAHILAQAARFVQSSGNEPLGGPIDVDAVQESDSRIRRLYNGIYSAMSELIDTLIEIDRLYIRAALGVSEKAQEFNGEFRNPTFDSSSMWSKLSAKVNPLLQRLPFELRVCTVDNLVGKKAGSSNEEFLFPLTLMRTIGNFANARQVLVLHWRDASPDKNAKGAFYLRSPVTYVPPITVVHKASESILEEGSRKSKNNPGSGGLHLGVCLTEFCKVNQLDMNDCWRCPRCKEYREGKQNMNLWRLPDLLTFHIKRFNCSARWREKITTKVNFPLTGLDVSEWCHPESPASMLGPDNCVYDLIAVVNHYGSMTGGHYVATCKATMCSPDGSEEVAYSFNGAASASAMDGEDGVSSTPTGWRLGGRKEKESVSQHRLAAMVAARGVSESAEPLWLQFDDELVEPIPPRNVVSEMAYVLFYRRRRLSPYNIAKYSTLD